MTVRDRIEGLISISSDTEQLGNYVLPKATDSLFEKYGPKRAPKQEAEAIRAGELQRQST